MAVHSSSRGRVPYSLLHNLSTVDLFYDERKKKRKTVGIFEAERVVARKIDREGIKYLIKWKGYSTFENTWEPEEHLAPASLRYFEEPNPPLDVVQSSVDRLRMAALDALRHKGPEQRISLEFRHDVFKYLFYGLGKSAEQKQWTLYEEKDFFRCKLPENWSCLYDCHGDGVKIRYPLKMRAFQDRSPKNHKKKGNEIVALPQTYVEKMSVAFIKIPSLCN